ncbi:MAG: SDR family NAD(P)-dependent oxidoreductase [Anaerolineales bacterium]|nr:SDR family NAD(P)-dependent oxidoreductase [Anaerolineales bacterium]
MMNQSTYTPPSERTHFLVSGGGKGITAENAIALARSFQSTFTLLGRSKLLEEEPEWAKDQDSEADLKQSVLQHYKSIDKKLSPKQMDKEIRQVLSSREINNTLSRIVDAGGEANYLQADITNIEQLKDRLNPYTSKINALVHGAGSLADKLIEEKQESDFDLVYGVKVDGLRNLLSLIPTEQLEYVVLFSSVAGFYGNAGQADYSLSNEILNKFAHHLKQLHPSCHILAVDWGPWDGGMVSPQLKRILTRKNIRVISLEEGTEVLVDLLSKPGTKPQWVIGNPMPFPAVSVSEGLKSYRITRQLSLEANPFLADHVIGGNAVLPTVCAVGWFIDNCEKLYPGFQFYSMNDYSVFKGIIFDQTLAEEYLLELEEIDKSSEALLFQGKISSESPNGKLRNHYQAQVELRKKIPERPSITGFDLNPDHPQDGKWFYGEKILFHGPRFQGVEEVLNITPKGLTTRCNLGSFSLREQGQFPVRSFNHFMADIHLQSLLIWASSQLGSIGLPLKIVVGTQYEPISFDTTTYATMRVKSSSKHKLIADVISHDEAGLIYSQVTGAEITLNTNLFDLVKENKLDKEPIWL